MKLLQKYYIGCPRKFQLKFWLPKRFFDDSAIRNTDEEIAEISENGSGTALLVDARTCLAFDSMRQRRMALSLRERPIIEIGRY